MKHPFMQSIYHALWLILSLGIHPDIQTAVAWNNSIVVSSVTDDDITVSGTNTLDGGISVNAITRDVTILVNAGDAIIQAGTTDASGARLYLFANPNRTITLDLRNNLTFRGATNDIPLLIVTAGNGTISILLDDATHFILTSDATHAGTLFVCHAQNGSNARTIFRRRNQSNDHVEITIGPKSLMTGVAPTGFDAYQSRIVYEPTNIRRGRMVLRIQDQGAFVLTTYTIPNISPTTLLYSDIDFLTPAEVPAYMTIEQVVPTPHTGNTSLLVINENATLTDFISDPWATGAFSGIRYGFILSDAGLVELKEKTYLDYVGTTTNICPTPTIPNEILAGRTVASIVKPRNPSALIVDGLQPTAFSFAHSSALYLRSGVDNRGIVHELDAQGNFDFTIDPTYMTRGMGNILLDLESFCSFLADSFDNLPSNFVNTPRKIEILSLQVGRNGGSVVPGSGEINFPQRTFARDDKGQLLRYNSGCLFVNDNATSFLNTCLQHTDENHLVIDKNDIDSEPTYVGGDRYTVRNLTADRNKPSLHFIFGHILLNSSAALTGVTVHVPEAIIDHASELVSFYNGRAIDHGTGRSLILGTSIGSYACDDTTIIDHNAYIYVQQQIPAPSTTHTLLLNTAANDGSITENLDPSLIQGQYSIHDIYLGHDSNIQIGTDGDTGLLYADNSDTVIGTFDLTTYPQLIIASNFYAFETRGGELCTPLCSSITGVGGIFVDKQGFITIDQPVDNKLRAYVNAMATKSRSGIIDLPQSSVLFGPSVGIANRSIDIQTPEQSIIIPANEQLSDYTLFWPEIMHNAPNFMPYEIGSAAAFKCLPVTKADIASLPTVLGTVEQLQIKGSRIGDAAHIMIDGGSVRELVFLSYPAMSAQAPVAVIVVQNDARIGLGSAQRSVDSLYATMWLGLNGITIIANGDGTITLNQDLIINNTCHILAGPDFGVDCPQRLAFYAPCNRSIIVKAGGILDLSSFTSSNQFIEFTGYAQLVLEPGSIILLNGGKLIMSDNTQIITGQLA